MVAAIGGPCPKGCGGHTRLTPDETAGRDPYGSPLGFLIACRECGAVAAGAGFAEEDTTAAMVTAGPVTVTHIPGDMVQECTCGPCPVHGGGGQ